jgi:hypothetical protein
VAETDQVERYWKRYGMVLVTNFRAFALIGKGPTGQPCILESFALADSENEFWRLTAHPRQAAAEHGERMLEYLKRVLLHNAPLAAPQDVAGILASYAHDARLRIEQADLPALTGLRQALEDALGLRFEGDKGVAVTEERELSTAYRTTKRVAAPKGQGLNDLYVRFFRMAERGIVEKNGQGVVCFISNYSWLDGLSFRGMRERYVEAFDKISIDCLNGDKYKTGKLTPDGAPDPSVFSTEFNREGIQVGTAIALMVKRQAGKSPVEKREIFFRHLWGKEKRSQLASEAIGPHPVAYSTITALRGGLAMGLTEPEMRQVVLALTTHDFYKAMTTLRDPQVWQDVYHGMTRERVPVYIKITAFKDRRPPVIQFKEK